MEPPYVIGQLFVSKTTITLADPITAVKVPSLRYLLLQLNLSEPLRDFDLSSALQLSGTATLLSAKCFVSAEMAAEVAKATPMEMAAVGSAPTAMDGSWQPPPIQRPASAQLGQAALFAAASGLSYVQSCLAVLFASEGDKPSITVLNGSMVTDLAGNPVSSSWYTVRHAYQLQLRAKRLISISTGFFISGQLLQARSLLLETELTEAVLGSNPATINGTGGRFIGVILKAVMVITIAASFISLWSSHVSMLQTVYHFQPSPRQAQLGYVEAEPARQHHRFRTLISAVARRTPSAVAFETAPMPSLLLKQTTSSSTSTTINKSPDQAIVDEVNGVDVLLSWLRNKSQFGDGNNTNPTSIYAIGGTAFAGSGKSLTFLDRKGHPFANNNSSSVVANSTAAPSTPPDASSSWNNNTNKPSFETETQGLLFMFTVVAVLMGSLLIAHIWVVLLFRTYVGPDLPSALYFPRAEIALAGPLLVAIAFYASHTLSSGTAARWTSNRIAALLAILIVLLPYVITLWWLTASRWYLEEKPGTITEAASPLGPHWDVVPGADAGGPFATSDDCTVPAKESPRPSKILFKSVRSRNKRSMARNSMSLVIGRSRHLLSFQQRAQQQGGNALGSVGSTTQVAEAEAAGVQMSSMMIKFQQMVASSEGSRTSNVGGPNASGGACGVSSKQASLLPHAQQDVVLDRQEVRPGSEEYYKSLPRYNADYWQDSTQPPDHLGCRTEAPSSASEEKPPFGCRRPVSSIIARSPSRQLLASRPVSPDGSKGGVCGTTNRQSIEHPGTEGTSATFLKLSELVDKLYKSTHATPQASIRVSTANEGDMVQAQSKDQKSIDRKLPSKHRANGTCGDFMGILKLGPTKSAQGGICAKPDGVSRWPQLADMTDLQDTPSTAAKGSTANPKCLHEKSTAGSPNQDIATATEVCGVSNAAPYLQQQSSAIASVFAGTSIMQTVHTNSASMEPVLDDPKRIKAEPDLVELTLDTSNLGEAASSSRAEEIQNVLPWGINHSGITVIVQSTQPEERERSVPIAQGLISPRLSVHQQAMEPSELPSQLQRRSRLSRAHAPTPEAGAEPDNKSKGNTKHPTKVLPFITALMKLVTGRSSGRTGDTSTPPTSPRHAASSQAGMDDMPAGRAGSPCVFPAPSPSSNALSSSSTSAFQTIRPPKCSSNRTPMLDATLSSSTDHQHDTKDGIDLAASGLMGAAIAGPIAEAIEASQDEHRRRSSVSSRTRGSIMMQLPLQILSPRQSTVDKSSVTQRPSKGFGSSGKRRTTQQREFFVMYNLLADPAARRSPEFKQQESLLRRVPATSIYSPRRTVKLKTIPSRASGYSVATVDGEQSDSNDQATPTPPCGTSNLDHDQPPTPSPNLPRKRFLWGLQSLSIFTPRPSSVEDPRAGEVETGTDIHGLGETETTEGSSATVPGKPLSEPTGGLNARATTKLVKKTPKPSKFRLREDAYAASAPPEIDKRLLPLYPGKTVPMYMIYYRPCCWLCRLHVTPPVHFLARFEFLYEDGIGDGTQQTGRETKWILSFGPLNFTHKVLCAIILGTWGQHWQSVPQLAILCSTQLAILLYMVAWRPFLHRQRLVMELVCHGLELVLFICAFALLNAAPDNEAPTTYLMIACLLLTTLVAISYEVWQVIRIIKRVGNMLHKLHFTEDRRGQLHPVFQAAAAHLLTPALLAWQGKESCVALVSAPATPPLMPLLAYSVSLMDAATAAYLLYSTAPDRGVGTAAAGQLGRREGCQDSRSLTGINHESRTYFISE
ncbi:hypothetical protein VOLCADRAFT_95897 [Volvox carteri f. nagariensis]|uniref:Transmembrane protein n=1 Tax=Volvox carteri f. nagariensis TaxID=3068 RepID=D8U8N4_VOLCA|nr:uncharacterized protein VOLCADRAFT_95897 [Volvox carteri f. nagariensis]EFJ44012.1 hypothetical protein VOLCADRAFT_95897 [Volvox carteri f. nagariensis]|eukprot:XP_002955024.1 hypothetical protein VOLCADRAFT_95897 [Volvox carteri f. nagariensis]